MTAIEPAVKSSRQDKWFSSLEAKAHSQNSGASTRPPSPQFITFVTMMRRPMRKLFVPIALLATTTSCDKLNELTVFDISTTTEIVIPATTGINLPFSMTTPNIETNSSSTFENNDTRADLIQDIRLTDCELVITSPSSANFDFLNSIEIYISTQELPEVLVAEKQNIPEDGRTSLTLDVTNEDLSEYIKSERYDMRTKIVTDQVPGSEVRIDASTVFRVDAKVLGI